MFPPVHEKQMLSSENLHDWPNPKEHGSVLERMAHLKLLCYSLWGTHLMLPHFDGTFLLGNGRHPVVLKLRKRPVPFQTLELGSRKYVFPEAGTSASLSSPSPLPSLRRRRRKRDWMPHSSLVFFPFVRIMPGCIGKLWVILTLYWCGQHSLHPGSKQTTTFIGYGLDHK